jgi:hypothetical protein
LASTLPFTGSLQSEDKRNCYFCPAIILKIGSPIFDPIFKRDIFSTTIEFIKHFPIHFALIDAYISADGPFGIFTDKNLNHAEKIIGSEDIVATD